MRWSASLFPALQLPHHLSYSCCRTHSTHTCYRTLPTHSCCHHLVHQFNNFKPCPCPCRYQVHDKLVNFMAAVASEPPAFAAQLFANLFGTSGAPVLA